MLRLIHGAVNGGDEELAGTLIHPDFFSHAAPASRASGPAGFLATVRSLHQTFAGFRLEPQDVIAAEAKVVVRATASGGTSARPTGFCRRPASGRPNRSTSSESRTAR